MEITFTLTPDDLLQYLLYANRVSAVQRRYRRLTAAWLALMCGALILMVVVTLPGSPVAATIIAMAVAATFFSGLFVLMRGRMIRRALIRHIAEPRVQPGFGPCRIQFSREGIDATSPIGKSQVAWEQIWEIVSDGDHLYICLPGTTAYIIPRDSYHGPVSFDALPLELDRLRRRG